MPAEVLNTTGKVMTVLGPIEPDQLGATLMHELLFIALYKGVEPNDNTPATEWCLWEHELTMDMPDNARDRKPVQDNWVLLDEATAMDEAMEFRYHGGGTIVEVTSIGIRRDPLAMSRVSRCRPKVLAASRPLIPSTITARRTRRYTSLCTSVAPSMGSVTTLWKMAGGKVFNRPMSVGQPADMAQFTSAVYTPLIGWTGDRLALQEPNIMPSSGLDRPLSLKTPNMGNPGRVVLTGSNAGISP